LSYDEKYQLRHLAYQADMNIDPRHLAQLSAIVEEESFQLAAERMGLTQPAISRNMRGLEARLGSPLFERSGKRSLPTALAKRLARTGMAIRAAQSEAEMDASLMAEGKRGIVRIGAPPIVAGRYLTQILIQFLEEKPGWRVDLKVGLVPELRSMLSRGRVDIVSGPRDVMNADTGITVSPLVEARIGILCRVNHPLVHQTKVSPKHLQSHSWLAHSRDSLLRQQTEMALLESGVEKLDIVCEVGAISAALEIVSSTDLLTAMPVKMTLPHLEDRLKFLEFDHPLFHRPIGLSTRRNAQLDEGAKWLIDRFRCRGAT
jgi:DNA-binding transcriptional LysR family regulator